MPKSTTTKRSGASQRDAPYSKGQASGYAGAQNAIFKMKTDIGQHVLKNPGVAQAIVDKAELKQSDIVLEVGPGTGNLTVKILEKVKKVIAVELDPRMAAEVTKRVQGKPEAKRLEVLLGDVCKMEWPYFDVCISNTPYQISSPLTTRLLSHSPAPRVCVLMYQLEFAQRLLASPTSSLFSRLSLNTQMYATISHVMKVGKNNFKPPPAVESSVVKIVPKRPRPEISWHEWDGMLRIAFVRKNRTLRASFLGTQTIMDMLESNYRTWCAQNNRNPEEGVVPDDLPTGEDEWNGFMDIDESSERLALITNTVGAGDHITERRDLLMDVDSDENGNPLPDSPNHSKTVGRRPRNKVAAIIREKIRRVLEDETGLADRRARQCEEVDFLKLLLAMNREGIHFS